MGKVGKVRCEDGQGGEGKMRRWGRWDENVV